jgi:hypothetical protein
MKSNPTGEHGRDGADRRARGLPHPSEASRAVPAFCTQLTSPFGVPVMPDKPRVFAARGAERRRELGRRGGRNSQAEGTGHKFSHEKAVAAGSRGGKVAQARGTAHRSTSEEARVAARKRERKEQGPQTLPCAPRTPQTRANAWQRAGGKKGGAGHVVDDGPGPALLPGPRHCG